MPFKYLEQRRAYQRAWSATHRPHAGRTRQAYQRHYGQTHPALAAQKTSRARALYAERRAAGQCVLCGSRRDGAALWCRRCGRSEAAWRKVQRTDRKWMGMCRDCPRPIGGDGTTVFCGICAEKYRVRVRRRRRSRISA